MSIEKQIDEMRKDLVEIFDEEYEKRRIITADFTAIKMQAKGYRKQEWISVEERLPEECTHVIVHDEDGTVGEAFHSSGDYFEWVANEKMAFPTHWMPLPAPPKGD